MGPVLDTATGASSPQRLTRGATGKKILARSRGAGINWMPVIYFLRQLWTFVHPYRGRFFLGLLCGIGYGLVNGVLLGTVKVVVQLVFEGETNLRQQLENAPRWIHPLSHWLASIVPDFRPPTSQVGWLLVVSWPGMLVSASIWLVLGIRRLDRRVRPAG